MAQCRVSRCVLGIRPHPRDQHQDVRGPHEAIAQRGRCTPKAKPRQAERLGRRSGLGQRDLTQSGSSARSLQGTARRLRSCRSTPGRPATRVAGRSVRRAGDPGDVSSESAHSSSARHPGSLPARPGVRALVVFWVAWWLVCAGLWMVLDDTVVGAEMVDGAVAAAVGATGATLVYAERLLVFRVRVRWVRGWWRPLAEFVPDLLRLVRVLAWAMAGGERSAGVMRAVRFEVCADEGERNAQVAVASVVGSFAPNTIVLGIDERTGVMLVHQLVASPGDHQSVDPLGLG